MEDSGAPPGKNCQNLPSTIVSQVASLLHDVGQQGFSEYESRARDHMPDENAQVGLINAIASLRLSFSRNLKVASSGAFESLANAVLSCSEVPAPATARTPRQLHKPGTNVLRENLQMEMKSLCEQLQVMADEEKCLAASMQTHQHLCMDADSLRTVKLIVADSQQVKCLIENCREHIAQLKQEEALVASRNCADPFIAESGVNEMNDAITLCKGHEGQVEK